MHSTSRHHALSIEGACRYFDVDPDHGLSSDDVTERQETFGSNSLDHDDKKSFLAILIDQFTSLLTALLAGAVVLSYIFDDYAEGTAILIVILINAAIGFGAENKALQSIDALKKMGRSKTRVRRNGNIVTVTAEEIVPGDIVFLEAGDIVTADIRLIESNNLQCNESLLTGEPIPVNKSVATVQRQAAIHDRTNMVFKGTSVTRGSAYGVTVATGANTELGEISTLTKEATGAVSPLEHRLQKLSEQLLLVVLALSILLAIAGITAGREPLLMVKTGIALAVAAIPEGLPIVATLALARGMWKLARHHALVERLSAVETLGSVNVIFTDKTGTLTQNKMAVVAFNNADTPNVNSLHTKSSSNAKAFQVCALCYSGNDPDHLSDPMEAAIVGAAKTAGFLSKLCETEFPRVREEAFDPNSRMMATIHSNGDNYFYAIKGAPEAVLKASQYIASSDTSEALTLQKRAEWLELTKQLAAKGLRVLALAEKTTNSSEEPPYEGLIFLGLLSLEDPPRPDAADAINAAQKAGIRVIMVTGDNAATAQAIAAAVDIAGSSNLAMEGTALATLEQLPAHKLDQLLSTSVFARMAPHQKLGLIDLYQKNGAVVAMTGDGVNDAPALKKADVGIAMGVRGTEAAKEAAAMILKDDAFASIVIAIQQGRIIFSNIRKFVIYLMSCNVSEVLVVTFCMLAGLPLPLMPLQILFLNLVTDVFPALALGFGKGDRSILERPPRPKSEGLLQPRHWQSIIFYSLLMTASVAIAFLWALNQTGQNSDYANSIAFLTLALGQLWHVFNMRSSKAKFLHNQVTHNPFIWSALLLCLALIFTGTFWQPLAGILHITPPDYSGWRIIFTMSLMPFLIGQLAKVFGLNVPYMVTGEKSAKL